jgi:hypothetical protein
VIKAKRSGPRHRGRPDYFTDAPQSAAPVDAAQGGTPTVAVEQLAVAR